MQKRSTKNQERKVSGDSVSVLTGKLGTILRMYLGASKHCMKHEYIYI